MVSEEELNTRLAPMVTSVASVYDRSHGEICQTCFFGVSGSRYELNRTMETADERRTRLKTNEVRANGLPDFYANKERKEFL
mgnify:CR=1 FL=1